MTTLKNELSDYIDRQDHEAKVKTLGSLVKTLETCSDVVALVLRDKDQYCDIYYRGGGIVPVVINGDSPVAMCRDILKRVK